MPENYHFGGGAAETTLTLGGMIAMFLAVILILVLPRKFLVVPFLVVGILIPGAQTLVVAGVHVYIYRILILTGFSRAVKAKLTGTIGLLAGGFNAIDKAFLGWALCRAAAFMILYHRSDAAVNQFGFLWDSLGGYFLLRFAIHDEEDIRRTTKVFALIAIIAGMCMVLERCTMINVFAFVGGTHLVAGVRNGVARCEGPFAHPILAGAFGATSVPLFVGLWSNKKDRAIAATGIIAATAMAITAAASTSLAAYAGGILGLCLWPLRKKMRAVRWGIVFAVLSLAVVMKAPVWFLFAHIDLVGGSSGYHRAMLVDQCIRRFWDWWLLGASNNQNWGWDMWDVQNEFVAQALTGGLATFILFVVTISRAFGRLGSARKLVETDRPRAWLMWALGTVIFVHVIAFLGVDYFDQTRLWWYSCLAIVSAAAAPLLAKSKKPVQSETAGSPPQWEHDWQASSLQTGRG